MTDKLFFDFGKVFIYDHYIIVIINEGVILVPTYNEVLLNIVDAYYRAKPFVYITHRKHSYSVDPVIYHKTSQIENLKGFAVVSKDFQKKNIAEVERLFLDKPFEIFDTLEEAVNWAGKILEVDLS